MNNNIDALNLLIELGADLETINNDGQHVFGTIVNSDH
jgi:hypothetical protein